MTDQQQLEGLFKSVKVLKPAVTLEQVEAAIGDDSIDLGDDEFILKVADRIIELTELPNGNIVMQWYDGTEVEFRDMTVQDSIDLDQFRLDNAGKSGAVSPVLSSLKMLELLCVRWGDKPKAPIEDIKKLPVRDLKKVMVRVVALTEFFRIGD